MGHHGSYIVGHGSLLEWVNGSWVTVSDPLPALLTIASSLITSAYDSDMSSIDLLTYNMSSDKAHHVNVSDNVLDKTEHCSQHRRTFGCDTHHFVLQS